MDRLSVLEACRVLSLFGQAKLTLGLPCQSKVKVLGPTDPVAMLKRKPLLASGWTAFLFSPNQLSYHSEKPASQSQETWRLL